MYAKGVKRKYKLYRCLEDGVIEWKEWREELDKIWFGNSDLGFLPLDPDHAHIFLVRPSSFPHFVSSMRSSDVVPLTKTHYQHTFAAPDRQSALPLKRSNIHDWRHQNRSRSVTHPSDAFCTSLANLYSHPLLCLTGSLPSSP